VRIDPRSECVAVDDVGERDAGVTIAVHVVLELAEALLPLVGVKIPFPRRQLRESVLTVNSRTPFV
jgi:hypothetical protein